jgi:NAD(P)-dependent dehydrogenase (short-subunit alcohol dehydrogenase family)
MGNLEGKVVIITGGGRGIGRAHARRCASEGAQVVVNDTGGSPSGLGHDPAVADAVVAEIRAAGGDSIADYNDVGRPAGVDGLFQKAIERYGKVDILITSAAIIREALIGDISDEDWDVQMATMLGGTFRCTQALVRHLQARKSPGHILMVTSLVGLEGASNLSAYAAAKAGICGFGLSASQELAPLNINVNILSPIAYTRLTSGLPLMDIPNAEQLMAPDLVSDVAVFLVSDAASEISGNIVHVQGIQVSTYKIGATVGVPPKDAARWSSTELSNRWSEIVR